MRRVEADLKANRILLTTLREHFPEDGILSEETKDSPERLGKSRVWIIDPIDGTKSFMRGVPLYAVLLALEVEDEVVVGAAYFPATGELIWSISSEKPGDQNPSVDLMRSAVGRFTIDDPLLLDSLRRMLAKRPFELLPFTDPELARVGLNESEATARRIDYRTVRLPMAAVLRTRTTSEPRGFMKMLIEKKGSHILGFTVFGAEASELMAAVQTCNQKTLELSAGIHISNRAEQHSHLAHDVEGQNSHGR